VRILAIVNCPLDDFLGSGYVIRRHVQGLRERGHFVEVLEPANHRWPAGGRRGERYRQMMGMLLAARQAAAFDVVIFSGGEAWLAIEWLGRTAQRPLMVALSNGIEPHVQYHLQAAGLRPPPLRPEWPGLMARGFRGVDGIVTVSTFDREFACRQGYQPSERVVAIENPLPDDYLGLRIEGDRLPQLIVCGSWIPRKGIDLLRIALPRFLQEAPAWRVLLVGAGGATAPLGQLPQHLASRVTVVPNTPRPALRELYLASEIAIQASIYESFGLASAEAMACGCALVATRRGFAAGLSTREAFLLPDPPSGDELAARLVDVATDEKRRRAVAAEGHRRVQSLRWSDATAALNEVLHRWQAEPRKRRR
jgi:glycosyltransferase involved in cell wall biosynthesis